MKSILFAKIFLILIALPTALVGLQGFFDPQAVMGNVDVVLGNVSAKSSTRALYGGVNLAYALLYFYGAFRLQRPALLFLSIYSTGYALGRLMSLAVDGQPNAFISTWIFVEIATAVIAWLLYFRLSRLSAEAGDRHAGRADHAGEVARQGIG